MRLIAPMLIAASVLAAAVQPPKDPQSSYEPRSTPGLGQKYLQKFVGEWEVQKVFYPATGEPVRAGGECPVDDPEWKVLAVGIRLRQGGPEIDGAGNHRVRARVGKIYQFLGRLPSDPHVSASSREPFDGDKIVLYSLSLEPAGKDSRRSKTISRLEDKGGKLVHRQFALGLGGEERLMMELLMTRKP